MNDRPAALCAGPCRPDDKGGPRRATPGCALCDVCEERCWEDLHWIADHWGDLTRQLTRPESSAYDGMPRAHSEETGIDLNEKVSDLRRDVTQWLHYWTRVILDDNPGFTGPKDHPVAMARYIAQHSRRVLRCRDTTLAASLANEARAARRKVYNAAFPSGARLYVPEPKIRCVEHGTSDLGERIPCPGYYQAWVTDRFDGIPDMHCSEDKNHVLTPAGFRRAGRTAVKDGPAARLFDAILGTA